MIKLQPNIDFILKLKRRLNNVSGKYRENYEQDYRSVRVVSEA